MILDNLPYPPSVNTYWRMVKGRMLISRAGREYRAQVAKYLMVAKRTAPLLGDLWVEVAAHPPDRRRRDIDNILKALLDAMGKAGVYNDDSQIKRLLITMEAPLPGGRVDVLIRQPGVA